MSTIIEIPVTRLQADPQFQPREMGLDREHLERLRTSNPATWPPLVVSPNETGGCDVIDGFHRLQVAQERQLATLRCEVVEDAGYPEAVAANLHHGLPLSIADRKAFAVWLHEQEPGLSYRELARQSGLSDKTVKAALAEVDGAEGADEAEDAEDAENPQRRAPLSTPAPPDPVEKLVRLAALAIAERTGVDPLAQFFSHKSDARQRAEHITRVIRGYALGERSTLAAALTALGAALIEGARPYRPQ